ncbi:MAG: hypothetical protein IPN92_02170 [Chromatiaceae bacterium]|nr:hypothetical protein [Chromatiaceae bacterium]
MIWLSAIIIIPVVIGYITYKLTLNKLEKDRFYRHINGLAEVTNSGSPGIGMNQYIICLKNGKVHYEFGWNWMSITKKIPQDTDWIAGSILGDKRKIIATLEEFEAECKKKED